MLVFVPLRDRPSAFPFDLPNSVLSLSGQNSGSPWRLESVSLLRDVWIGSFMISSPFGSMYLPVPGHKVVASFELQVC